MRKNGQNWIITIQVSKYPICRPQCLCLTFAENVGKSMRYINEIESAPYT